MAPLPPSLEGRIRWILENRGFEGNQRQLSRDAGLKDAHVAVILHRLKKNPGADVENDTLTGIARAGRVSLRWLSTGEGSPDASDVPAPTSPQVVRLDAEQDTEIERAIAAAFEPARHSIADLRAALDAGRDVSRMLPEHADIHGLAAGYLEAARWLRSKGERVTVPAIYQRHSATATRAPTAHVAELSAADNAQGALEAERLDHPERFDVKTGERIVERDVTPPNAPKPKRKTK